MAFLLREIGGARPTCGQRCGRTDRLTGCNA